MGITTSHNNEILYTTGSVASTGYIDGGGDDFYISTHFVSTGNMITFKVFGGTGNE